MINSLVCQSSLEEILNDFKIKNKIDDFKVIVNSWGALDVFIQSNEDEKVLEDLLENKIREKILCQFIFPDNLRPISSIKIFTKEEREYDSYLDSILAGTYLPPKRRRLETWFIERQKRQKEVPIIVFYSYKGGVGRTTALIFSALKLAQMGKKVAVIDFDLEAPGIDSLFLENKNSRGVVDYLIEKPYLKDNLDPKQYIYEVDSELIGTVGSGSIYVMPAGKIDEYYIEKLSHIDFDALVEEDNLLENLVDDIIEYTKADIIFVDSRTGINEIGGSLFFYLADVICTIFQNNEQNKQGLKILGNHLKNYQEWVNASLLWVHSIIGESGNIEVDRKFQKEMKEFVKEIDFNKKDFEGRYFEIPRISELERLNRDLLLSEKILGLMKYYEKLAYLFKSYIKEDRGFNTELARKILNQFFDEDFRDVTDKKYFMPISKYRDIISEKNIIIYGIKGSGKRTLYNYLKNNFILLKDYFKIEKSIERKIVEFTIDELNKIEDEIDEISKISNIQDKSKLDKKKKVYIYKKIAEKIEDPEFVKFDEFDSENNDLFKILEKINFQYYISIDVSNQFHWELLNILLSNFPVNIKVFVNGFVRNKLPGNFKHVILRWNKKDLYSMLLKRVINCSPELLNELETKWRKIDDFRVLYRESNFGYIPNPDEDILRFMISELFGERVSLGSNNLTYDWLYNTLAKKDRAVPGALLQFVRRVLNKIKEKVHNQPDFYEKHPNYLPLYALTEEELEECLQNL
ncbi:hypothetical protein BBF96_08330 [Anoxybacter fermentans]|uniref:AAA domain-containing protein n=1 Tax=Anoxybacter fermentans TaxID=1323375 RepID=A0A3Q9HQE3_9FIRM|nr:AAA family ATPase [Anoxybacter fermentans]AZR73387.1 hypothetical protein BBF96_08330 [Anoxybacter fermentans]